METHSSLPLRLTSDGASLAQSLPKLTQESELQKMLADERMRCETHKTNYQTVKAEHTKLQDDFRRVQRELDRQREDGASMEERFKSLMARATKEIAEKTKELEDLKTQTITPQKLELMKVKIAEDLEQPFRERFSKLDQEVEFFRSEYNKLRYEHSFVKSEYEHQQAEHKRVLEELKLQYESEISNLHKDKEAIIAKYTSENSHDGQRVRTLHRENAALNQKVKGLLNELEEIRAQREQAGLQSDHVSRLQARQLTEHMANVKALETEKESLKMHAEQLQKELDTALDVQRSHSSKVHDLEKTSMELKGQLEETLHQKKIEVTNAKMEMVKCRGELERQRDMVENELEDYKSKVEVLQRAVDLQTNAVTEKEKDIARRVQAAREEEWAKVNQLEGDKLELEARVQEMEKAQLDVEGQRQAERDNWEQQIRDAVKQKDQAEKDLHILRTKFDHQSTLERDLEQERQETNQLRETLHQKETQLQSLHGIEQELNVDYDKLRNTHDILRDEFERQCDESLKKDKVAQSQMHQLKVAFQDEKDQLQRRIQEMEENIERLHAEAKKRDKQFLKKRKQYKQKSDQLENKVQLLKAKKEELEIQCTAYKIGTTKISQPYGIDWMS
ncbi:centrosomal protein of 83 kDa-like isoform X2 [Amphiura filiformis]|uniref:centrosomal protein of 83 kDa-like isoform X2 n=1 Tax=Amphiura filiformis TaxID=82378 RepID=UPI003B20FE9D